MRRFYYVETVDGAREIGARIESSENREIAESLYEAAIGRALRKLAPNYSPGGIELDFAFNEGEDYIEKVGFSRAANISRKENLGLVILYYEDDE